MRKTNHRLPALNHHSHFPAYWISLTSSKITLLALAYLLAISFALNSLSKISANRMYLTLGYPSTNAFDGRTALDESIWQTLFTGYCLAGQGLFPGGLLNTPAWNFALDGSTIDMEEYWQLAEDTRDQATWAKNRPPNEIRPSFLQAANVWENLDSIRLPDSTNIPIDTSVIVTELRAEPPDPEQLEALLNAMLEQRESWPAGPFGTADIQNLTRILAKPEYQWSEEAPPSPLEKWIARQFEHFMNWLFEALEGRITSTGLRIWQVVLISLGALALAFILGYVGRNLRRAGAAEAELGNDNRFEENLSASAALSKAQAMSAGGDYRMAARYLYLAALLQLEERGLLRYDRSRTNREYLGDIMRRRIPGLSDSFAEVVDVFDRVWYGYQPLDQAGYENYSEMVAQVGKLRE